MLAGPRGWRSGAPSCLRISTGSETGRSRSHPSNHSARGSGKGSVTATFNGSEIRRSASSSVVSPPQLKLRLLLDSSPYA